MPKDSVAHDQIDVFISYKREERALAVKVAAALEAAGYTQVTDINLQTGKHFGLEIQAMIKRARVVMVLWTPLSVTSEWVLDEADLGKKLGTYLGVMVQQTEIPLGLNRVQYLDLGGADLDDSLPRVVAEVTNRIGSPKITALAASSQSQAVSDDMLFFQTADRVDSIEGYEGYLNAFPNGYMAAEAKVRIRRLSTFGYRLWKYRGSVIALIGIAATVAVAILPPMLEPRPVRGDLTIEEEGDLRERLEEAEESTSKAVLAAKQEATDAAQEEIEALQDAISDLEEMQTQLKIDLSAAKKQANLLPELQRRLEETQTALQSATQDLQRAQKKVAALEAQLADRTNRALQASVPKPDCTASNGQPGYRLNNGDCIGVNVRRLILMDDKQISNQDLEKIAGLTALQTLSLYNTQVSNIAPLENLTALQTLSLYNTQVSNIAPLENLTTLQTLSLTGTQVGDITPLENLTALQRLYLSGTQVTNFNALFGMDELHYLELPNGLSIGHWSQNTPSNRNAVQAWIDDNT